MQGFYAGSVRIPAGVSQGFMVGSGFRGVGLCRRIWGVRGPAEKSRERSLPADELL